MLRIRMARLANVALSWCSIVCINAAIMALIAGSAQVGAVEPVSLIPASGAMPRAYFGMHVHSSEKRGHWPAVTFGAWRLWDAGTVWANLEPQRGDWNFWVLDADIERAEESGAEVLLVLAMTPSWASARPTEPTPYGPGLAAEAANMEDWRAYVRKVALRYHGKIAAYQIWNEAPDKTFFSGDIDKLVELTKIAYQEIKRVDPAALVVSPSDVGFDAPRLNWVRKFLDAGGGKYVDVVSYHLYHDRGESPESMVKPVQTLRALLTAGGYGNLPLWNTESGYFVLDGTPRREDGWQPYTLSRAMSLQTAAQYVPRDLLLARALGFERYYMYAWDNRMMGFIDPVTLRMRPAGEAFGKVASLLTRSTLERCDRRTDGAWLCRLVLANGRKALALWRDPQVGGPVAVKVPFAGTLKSFDGGPDGQVLSGDTLNLDGDVVMLVAEDASPR
jgi:hypothetical protein